MASQYEPQDAVAGAEIGEHQQQSILSQHSIPRGPSVQEPVELEALPQQPQASTTQGSAQQPKSPHSLHIELMLASSAKHPWTLDEHYLRSRPYAPTNSNGEVDPLELSGYQFKELILTDWRSEWESKPANPAFIRLIVMGRMIEDNKILRDYRFNTAPGDKTVVHMNIRPADAEDPDDAAGTAKSNNSTSRRSRSRRSADNLDTENSGRSGSRCCVIL